MKEGVNQDNVLKVTRPAINVRKLRFDFSAYSKRFWSRGNPVVTHLANGLFYIFPQGEKFFIQSMRAVQDEIDDPELVREMRKFCGQEAHHALNHREFNKVLDTQGYSGLRMLESMAEGFFDRLISLGERFSYVRKFNVALSAAAEHYTSSLAHLVISNPKAILDDEDEMSSLLFWHMCEEIEHKSLCFDVYQSLHGKYLTRISAYVLITVLFLIYWIFATGYLYIKDGTLLSFKNLGNFFHFLLGVKVEEKPGFLWRLINLFKDYFKPGFHPWDIDDQLLTIPWRQLYEEGGDIYRVRLSEILVDSKSSLMEEV